MLRVKRSLITAFLSGLSLAAAATVGAIAVLLMLSPPTSDDVASPAVNQGPHQARTEALPANTQLTLSDDLKVAHARVAQQMADVEAQRVLTRSIQQELQRVGCYSGPVDGQWTERTKNGMAAFTQSLNVKLPLGAPDYILLTMLQGQRTSACQNGTPRETGTTTARAPERPRVRTPSTAAATVTTGSIPSTGRAEAKTAEVGDFRTSVVTATESVVMPAPPLSPSVILPFTTHPQTSAPLPGRMAVGAPIEQPIAAADLDAPDKHAVMPPASPSPKKARSASRAPTRTAREARPSSNLYSPPPQPRYTEIRQRPISPFARLSRDSP